MAEKKFIVSKNLKDTAKIAKIFTQELVKKEKGKNAVVVTLSGELGAGKTAFTQSAARHLGVSGKVASPTFVIIKKYPLKKTKKYKFLFHIDAYRLKNEKELSHLGWDEIADNKEHLIFIEWPENVKKLIPRHAKKIKITHLEKGHRSFIIK